MLVSALVMGFNALPENIELAVPPAVPAVVPGARLLINMGSTPAINCAVSAAFRMFNPAASRPRATLVASAAAMISGLAPIAVK